MPSPARNRPPPPSPKYKPTPPWPFCDCYQRSPSNAPYRLSHANSTYVSKWGATLHCFNVRSQYCDPRYECCNVGLHKLELFVNTKCRGAVKGAVLPCAPRAKLQWQQDTWWGATYGTLKITDLYLSRQDVSYGGVSLCLLLDSPCASLTDFCYHGSQGYCQTTMYDDRYRCCPVTDTSTRPSTGKPSPPKSGGYYHDDDHHWNYDKYSPNKDDQGRDKYDTYNNGRDTGDWKSSSQYKG